MIPDERPEHTTELWAHLFEGLQGYLVTFTGQPSTRPGARPNELDDTQQRSWRWPERRSSLRPLWPRTRCLRLGDGTCFAT